MKNIILRLFALVLALVMMLTAVTGCTTPNDNTAGNGGNTGNSETPSNSDTPNNPDTPSDPDNNDDPADTEPIQITTTIYEIAKYGNLILYMYGSDILDKGLEHGDILEIAIGDKRWDVPLCSSYNDVDNGLPVFSSKLCIPWKTSGLFSAG